MVVSLTTTPMMCAYVLRPHETRAPGRFFGWSERGFAALQRGYAASLGLVLRHPLLTMLVFLATVILNIDLYVTIPKGFFPQQDTGRIVGGIRADQSISFQAMRRKFRDFVQIVRQDPAVESVAGFTGGFSTNSGFVFATLKPLSERKISADQVIARLRPKLSQVPGAQLFLQAVQDIRVGGRQSNAQYQFTLQARFAARPLHLGAEAGGGAAPGPVGHHRRQLRPAAEGPAGQPHHRPRRRGAARRVDPRHLGDALRRLRPAPGLDHLQRAQPVSRGDGGRARVLEQPRAAEGHLRQHLGRRDQRRPGDRGHRLAATTTRRRRRARSTRRRRCATSAPTRSPSAAAARPRPARPSARRRRR